MGVHDQDRTNTSRYSLEQNSVVKFGVDFFVRSYLIGLSVRNVREKKKKTLRTASKQRLTIRCLIVRLRERECEYKYNIFKSLVCVLNVVFTAPTP